MKKKHMILKRILSYMIFAILILAGYKYLVLSKINQTQEPDTIIQSPQVSQKGESDIETIFNEVKNNQIEFHRIEKSPMMFTKNFENILDRNNDTYKVFVGINIFDYVNGQYPFLDYQKNLFTNFQKGFFVKKNYLQGSYSRHVDVSSPQYLPMNARLYPIPHIYIDLVNTNPVNINNNEGFDFTRSYIIVNSRSNRIINIDIGVDADLSKKESEITNKYLCLNYIFRPNEDPMPDNLLYVKGETLPNYCMDVVTVSGELSQILEEIDDMLTENFTGL